MSGSGLRFARDGDMLGKGWTYVVRFGRSREQREGLVSPWFAHF